MCILCYWWNLLKQLLVKKLLEENEIDILCMQETEVMKDINHNKLKIFGYLTELELNSTKSRVGFYISKLVRYVRRVDLEGSDSNLIIIDVEGTLNTRLINVYRSFAPQNNVFQREKFKNQLSLINTAMCNSNCILLVLRKMILIIHMYDTSMILKMYYPTKIWYN